MPSVFKDHASYILALAEFAEGSKVVTWLDKTIAEVQVASGMKLKLKASRLQNGQVSYVTKR